MCFSNSAKMLGLGRENSFVVVAPSLSHVRLFSTPWTAAGQTPLSSIISQSVLRLMSLELVMLSNHLILCYPLPLPSLQSFPALGSSPVSQLFTQVPKVLELQLQHQSFQCIFGVD